MARPKKPYNRRCKKCGALVAKGQTVHQHCPKASRCKHCGRILSKTKKHQCASVDAQGPRKCKECRKPLSNKGYARWKKRCPQCEKRHWRAKERALRRALKKQFGGCCCRCGYDRCFAALDFHHKRKRAIYKKQQAAWLNKGTVKVQEVRDHPERFLLLCANCHREEHNGEEV
jgi:hypothetical protein